MCIYYDYCVYHYKSTELVSLYTLDIGLQIKIIIKYYYDWFVFLHKFYNMLTLSFHKL